ncbi:MAG: SelT/SelW/SelH family protein [Nitrospinae bacterium]|nr:SelT/SelW/SelH family protein [Nitrospinota bacterium]
MKAKLGIIPEMTAGSGGIFDVHADGELVFSKYEAGRFPDNAEIVEKLSALGKS